MVKKILISILAAVIVVAGGASAYSALAAPDSGTQSAPEFQNFAADSSAIASASSSASVATSPQAAVSAAPTADETAGLLYMYEEEKLARDIYNALYSIWGQATFQNIAASEQTHMDSVKVLLDRYGIASPSAEAGTFNDPALQSLYNDLMNTGSTSLGDALKVGTTIEEVDIMDLQSRLEQTTNADIQLVYTNLMNGSFNHLRNFVNVLERLTGEIYKPQYLSADLYDTIISSANGNGQSNRSSQGYGRGKGSSAGSNLGTGSSATTSTRGNGYRGGR
jgi:hypothetical protein